MSDCKTLLNENRKLKTLKREYDDDIYSEQIFGSSRVAVF